MPSSAITPSSRSGFTLVEILIVVVILGVLAGLVVPQFTQASDDARRAAFIADIETYSDAAYLRYAQTGELLEDSASGALPDGFEEYVNAASWTDGTPIGGVWDAENNTFGVTSALGVHFNGTGETRDQDFMVLVDGTFDDGDLADGGFQQIADDRYYSILVD